MKILSSLKSTLKLAAVSTAAIATTSLTNCGGGGSASGDGEYTLRPKTLEGVTLSLANSVSFEFIRNSSSSAATENGDTEFGGMLYTANANAFTANSIDNFPLEIVWPTNIGPSFYTYSAINDTSGVIVVTASNFTFTGLFPENSHNYFSNVAVDANGGSSARMIVSFLDNGGYADQADIRIEDPENPLADVNGGTVNSTVLTNGQFTVGGGALIASYNTNDDFDNRQSKMSLATIGGNTITFTDDTDTTDNFSLQLTSSATGSLDYDDLGQTVYFDDVGTITVGAADYMYQRILGTDNASLILSGGTENDGTVDLLFLSPFSDYQSSAGVYTTPSGNTGTFVIITTI